MEKIFRKSIFTVSEKQGNVINFAKLASTILNDKLKNQCQISKIHAKFQEHYCFQKTFKEGVIKNLNPLPADHFKINNKNDNRKRFILFLA